MSTMPRRGQGNAPPAFSESHVAANICRQDLYFFIQEFWDIMVPAKPVWNWHIKYLCGELQEIMERVFRGDRKLYDLIINISPGSTKSTVASVALPAWCWTRYPQMRSICGSHTQDLALDLARKSREVIQSDKYREYFPEIVLREDQNTKTDFANTANGMRFSRGTGGSVIGRHGDLLDVDDPIDPQSSLSEEELKTANDWISGTLSQRKVNKETAVMIITMQRLHQNDPTGYWLDRNKNTTKHICIPAEINEYVSPVFLKQFYTNGLMDPIRLTRAVLDEQHVTLGDYGYAGQYLQHPIPPGGAMFRVDVLLSRRGPRPTRFREIVRFWDKAGTHKGGAFSVGFMMGKDFEGRFWILDIKRGQWSSDIREMHIVQTAQLDGRGVLVGMEQEPGSGGKESAEGTIRRLAGWRVKAEPARGDKVSRADEFAVQVNSGNVWIPEGELPWLPAYVAEMQYFPYSTYKDQIDASSGCFAMLAKNRTRVGAL